MCGLCTAVLLHRKVSLSLEISAQCLHHCVLNGQTLLSGLVLLLKLPCPGCYLLIERKLQPALLIFSLKRVPASFSFQAPYRSRVTNLLVCLPSSEQVCPAQLKTKEDTLALSQTLTDRKPELSYNVKGPYKMPGEMAPRVDMPSNKQALGIKHFACAISPLSLRPVVLNLPNSVTQ